MRLFLTIFAIFAACPSWADEILARSEITEVTVHPDGATIARSANLRVPEGRHRLILQDIPVSTDIGSLRAQLDGARMIATVIREDQTPPRDQETPEVTAAKARLKAVEDQIQDVVDAAEKEQSAARAAELSIEFLRQLGNNEGLAETGPDTLRDISRMIQQEAATAQIAALNARIAARQVEEQLEDLEIARIKAEQALNAVALEDEDRIYVALEIETTQDADIQVQLSYLVTWDVGWAPAYDFSLLTQDPPQLEIRRDLFVYQQTGENWNNVTLHLTTTEASHSVKPPELRPRPRRIFDPVEHRKLRSSIASDSASLQEPAAEAPLLVEETGEGWAISDGIGTTYTYPEKVSVASGADRLRLTLDTMTADVTLSAYAAPLQSEDIFRVVAFENTSGERLLPSGLATRYVDGALVGSAAFAGLDPGEEAKLGFGPIEGMRVSRDILNKSEGERGIISRGNQQVEKVEIEVVNQTSREWPLRLEDRVPYSEQDDLEIDWTAAPAVSVENVDKKRGILGWDLDLGAGNTKTIRLDTTLSWPEGMQLR